MMVGKVYGLQKIYKQRDNSKTYLTDTRLFTFESERDHYCEKYITGQKNSRVLKLYFFEANIKDFREVDLNEGKEQE